MRQRELSEGGARTARSWRSSIEVGQTEPCRQCAPRSSRTPFGSSQAVANEAPRVLEDLGEIHGADTDARRLEQLLAVARGVQGVRAGANGSDERRPEAVHDAAHSEEAAEIGSERLRIGMDRVAVRQRERNPILPATGFVIAGCHPASARNPFRIVFNFQRACRGSHRGEARDTATHIDALSAVECGQISARDAIFRGVWGARCGERSSPALRHRPQTPCMLLLSERTFMKLLRLVLTAAFTLALAAPAAAQRYTAKQDGDVIELADTSAQMNVSVVWSMSNAWRIQVKGKDLVRASATLADFQARPGFNGMPLLAPFANRLDETAFYANGKKYNFDLELGNVRGPIPSTGFVNGSKAWQLVEFKADGKSAWVTCKLDFYKNPQYMQQFPFAHTITMTYRVADGALEVRTRLDNLSNEPMPVVIGYHPVYELPDGTRNDWTVSADAKTHWIEIPQRLPTGETQPIENFFGSDRTAIQLGKYALIDDVFTDLVRDANGRATMKLLYNGKELHVSLGPKYKTVLMWSTPLGGGGGGGRGGGAGRAGGQGQGAPAAGGGRAANPAPTSSGPFPVDPAQGVKVAPPAVPPAEGAPAPTTRGFIAFEPMVAITNALNLAHKGVYKDLQSIPPAGSWEESFWITTKGY